MKFKDPIVGEQYDEFVAVMLRCAEKNQLPQLMEIRDVSKVTLLDIHSFMLKFTKDTLLNMKFQAELCPYCDKLHAFLFVDYPEVDEQEPLN